MCDVHTPSGDQHVIAFADQRAVVTELGATLRAYERADEEICWGFPAESMCDGCKGQVLAPWPNRLRDGRYEFDGVVGQAPIDEPERSNAIHGIVRWVPWHLVEKTTDSVVLEYRLFQQPAYPFQLLLRMHYRLGEGGLTVMVEATAEGDARVPFGVGFHPYFATGPGGVDNARLAIPARERLVMDERALPTGLERVEGTPFERIAGDVPVLEREAIGSLRADECFTGVERDGDGRWRVELLAAGHDSPTVVWADEAFGYIMCYTGDTLPVPDRRKAIAIEPMSCPPDALRTGDDLVVLDPGETFRASWGISPGGLTAR
jgi:aldose 1-epimerase